MTSHVETPGQTVGPFFHCVLPYLGDSDLVSETHADAVRLHGTVYDGAGDQVADALVELWQPDSTGAVAQRPGSLRRDGQTFTGWGRSATDEAGHFSFTTVSPGPTVPGRPAFFAITVFARGLSNRLFTRAYLPGGDFAADPLLATLGAGRRETLICHADTGLGLPAYRFDIRLQGGAETVFLRYGSEQR